MLTLLLLWSYLAIVTVYTNKIENRSQTVILQPQVSLPIWCNWNSMVFLIVLGTSKWHCNCLVELSFVLLFVQSLEKNIIEENCASYLLLPCLQMWINLLSCNNCVICIENLCEHIFDQQNSLVTDYLSIHLSILWRRVCVKPILAVVGQGPAARSGHIPFVEIWSWSNFYGYSLPTSDSTRH